MKVQAVAESTTVTASAEPASPFTETFDSYTQLDMNISPKQTATASFAIFLQKLDYDGLNTFTPQPSTPDLNERGYPAYLQDRYITDSSDLLVSQVTFRKLGADLVPNSNAPYQLLIETTKGGLVNRQSRDTAGFEWLSRLLLTRSQPRFLSSMGRAVHEAQKAAGQNDWAWIETAYDYVKRDHEIWTQAAHLAGSAGLSRYYDSGEGPAEEALPDENDVYRQVAAYFLLHPTLPRIRRSNSLKWK